MMNDDQNNWRSRNRDAIIGEPLFAFGDIERRKARQRHSLPIG
jgi:hypothetical protein